MYTHRYIKEQFECDSIVMNLRKKVEFNLCKKIFTKFCDNL